MRIALLAAILLSAEGRGLRAEVSAEGRGLSAEALTSRFLSPPSPALSTLLSPQPSALRVYLITVGQGAAVWEKFGHNALWFFDGQDVDEAYNWGTFDFKQPHFIQRFLTGDTRYWVEQYPGMPLMQFYREADRGIVVQRLNFSAEQATRALAYARWNAREENKYYRYDYYRDNCSTRVRDVIDYALGGALKRQTANIRTSVSYRSETVRLVDDLTLTQLGIDIALGEPADRRISLWEAMFIPMRMRDGIRGLRVSPDANAAKLVAEERVWYQSKQYQERSSVPRLWIPYLIIGLVLGAEFLAVGRARGRARVADRLFRIEVAVWAFVTGLVGLILLLAWTTTRHVFWYGNENLLLFNPLSLWLFVSVLLSFGRERFARHAAILAAIIAGAGVAAFVVKAIPAFRQDNLAILCLVLPANVAIAWGMRGRRKEG